MLKYLTLPIIFIIIYFSTLLQNAALISLPALPISDSVLLVPLDSRPVCSTMVQKLGKLAGINVIVPPKELLDNYQEPADGKKLWQWLQIKAPAAKTSIVSADILLHGSLLQTRQHIATEAEQNEFLSQLAKLQKELKVHNYLQAEASTAAPSPHQLQLFSVIPRLLVSDEVYPDCWYQWHLMRYSQLLDMVQINGDFAMTQELCEYKQEIPPDILNKYTSIFTQSQSFNEKLLAILTQQAKSSNSLPSTAPLSFRTNIAAPLVIIGQDDSSPFGLPKMTANQLERFITEHKLQSSAQLTYGADEIGALLLTRYFLQHSKWQPKLYVHYGSPQAEFKHMPYMAASVGATLHNQAQLVGAQLVATPNEADIILFVHCGDDDAKPTAAEVEQLAHELEQGKLVALIDLSANFEADEMLLPNLIEAGVPVNRLAAYAGWNTFSNSSGTALAQSIIFAGRLRKLQTQQNTKATEVLSKTTLANADDSCQDITALYAANLRFTAERMLEDYYYQKLIHPELRPYLESFGVTPTDLEPEEKQWTEHRIQERLALYADWLCWHSLSRTPFYADAHNAYYLTDLKVGAKLPWNRIFEVDLNVHSKLSCRPTQQ